MRKPVMLAVMLVLIACAVAIALAPRLAPHDPYRVDPTRRLEAPSREHWLGTDELGRDVWSRLLYGGRITLSLGLVATVIGLAAGGAIGVSAGYFRRLDGLLMRATDVVMAIPAVLLAIAVVAVLGPGLVQITVAVGVSALPSFARLTRAAVLSLREKEFVEASRAAGASDLFIIRRDVLPNVLPSVLVYASLHTARALLSVSILSFLGLGVQPPAAEWGAMVSGARGYLRQAPMLATVPSVAIFVVVLAFNLLGDELRDVLDPRLRGVV
ncbi:MAG: ABC transporter permease [Candidatus Rokuibacteriota bacterium]